MTSALRLLTLLLASFALMAIDGSAVAQPKDKEPKEQKQPKGQKDQGPQGAKENKEKKAKKQKHENGKTLVGDKIKKNGKQKFHENGKHSAFVNVKDGKIAGVSVNHAEKGEVPVKKYRTTKKMAQAPTMGMQTVSMQLAQAVYIETVWIGYSYYDDYGDEVIYWFPYDMIYDGETGAVEYIPVY